MSELVRIAVDAMGGDNAPGEIIKGAVDALNESDRIAVTLLGDEKKVKAELSQYQYPFDRLSICPTTEVIEMAEPPVKAIHDKKDSSIVRGMRMVKEGEADAFVTAGSTGATLVGGQILVGRIKGIERPPLAPLMPTAKGPVLLIDCGANVDPRSSHLVQFAQMGSIYYENMIGKQNPRVALYNIGAEKEKGNSLVKETYPLLEQLPDINFVGNIEARDIPQGAADVVVCDAFTGNAILKMYEGVAITLLGEVKKGLLSSLRSKIGAFLIKPALKDTLKKFSVTTYGGAPLLGLTGLVVKTHGSAKAIEVKNSILQCETFKEKNINGQFRDRMHLVDRTRHTTTTAKTDR
ncbi:phosphate:acyl-[acyl carrier protein] acyltransferase [Lachnospiraceae bacterium NK3A20]|nr:phosphate:acyl-[acyl carrier protein] acyltransferase [Lachnospiraceae bacterium NK3A20]